MFSKEHFATSVGATPTLAKPMRRPAKLMRIALVAFVAPKVRGMFIELNVAFVVAINWWIISTPPRTALAKHLITKTSRPAINSVCLCLASGQWICLAAWLPHWLSACPPKKQKKKNIIKEQQQQQKRSTGSRRGENSAICHFVGPPLFVLFWGKEVRTAKSCTLILIPMLMMLGLSPA